MPRLYRVEHPETKVGPYHTFGSDWYEDEHSVDTGRPGPCDDFGQPWFDLSREVNEPRFAFATLRQLKSWFTPGELAKLKERGMVIARFTAPILLKSDKQVVYDHAKRKELTQ